MHTYQGGRVDTREHWVVGHHFTGEWVEIEDCKTEGEARRLVNYLNGGTGHSMPEKAK